jgi:hypothetical protein
VENGTVRRVPVLLAGPAGNDLLIAGGLTSGQTIVTAGVNQLKPGQKVKILDDGIVGPSATSTMARDDLPAVAATGTAPISTGASGAAPVVAFGGASHAASGASGAAK